MKRIEPIAIWDNGQQIEAKVIDATASVVLNQTANFNYTLFSLSENDNIDKIVTSGMIHMNAEEYATWTTDDIAWDFISSKLNLVIIGDYVKPTLE